MTQKQYTLAELTKGLDVTIKGDANCIITGVAPIQQAKKGEISFLTNSLYKKYLTESSAEAIILSNTDAENFSGNVVISSNPYFTYAMIAQFFLDKTNHHIGIHPSATIAEQSIIDATAHIGPNCVIGHNVKIGSNVKIGANTVVGDDCEIGDDSCLDAQVTIYHNCKIGKRVHITSGAVIGSDGFGFANQKGVWHKVPQLGGVTIGDDVDIGANTSIDRGAIEDTIIENGVKLDNLIQIGHNVKIGENTIIAGCVGIAGSAIIGKNCMIGGASSIIGHITIADSVMITGGTGVSKSIREPGIYSSGIVGVVPNIEFRKNNARFHRLENLMERVKKLETILKDKRENNDSD